MVPEVWVDAAVHDALVGALHADAEREFVGLLAGRRTAAGFHVTRCEPLRNAAVASDRFAVAPPDFLAAELRVRSAGLAWLGFVHSHPGGAAAPSAADRQQLWRDCLQLIVGSPQGTAELRAYRLTAGACEHLPLRIAATAGAR